MSMSLLQHSTPANQRSRQSSSSSNSASSNRDQAQGVPPQDMSVFSVVDGASLQKAIELSLQDSTVGGKAASKDLKVRTILCSIINSTT